MPLAQRDPDLPCKRTTPQIHNKHDVLVYQKSRVVLGSNVHQLPSTKNYYATNQMARGHHTTNTFTNHTNQTKATKNPFSRIKDTKKIFLTHSAKNDGCGREGHDRNASSRKNLFHFRGANDNSRYFSSRLDVWI